MSAGDDEVWFGGVAGLGDGTPAAREGADLRRALQERSMPTIDVPEVSPAREAQLLHRARREGVLPGAGRPSWRGMSRLRRFPLSGTLAAAAVAGLAVVVGILLIPGGSEETVRGPSPAMLVLEAADPEALRFALVDALREAGVDAGGYSVLGEHVVQATLPVPVPAEVVQVLIEHDLPVPEQAELVVRIRAAP